MRILLVHNYYLQPGGEDQVFSAETEVLRAHGEEVRTYTLHNNRTASMGRLSLASSTVWNRIVFRELTSLLQDYVPDIVHCHNTFPLISPAAYAAAGRLRIPVIQTLHNFRLLCLNGLFLRNGAPCEDCLGRAVAWPGVLHRCYRQSRQASTVVAAMLGIHRWCGTWQTAVDTYLAMSDFARAKFVAGGLPADRIVVKPNFLAHDPGTGAHQGAYALYVGRLSPEKGIASLVSVWERLAARMPLRIIGNGPLETLSLARQPGIEWLGWQPRERVLAAMKEASFLIFPTECYEGFPIVLLEAMATGLPIIASRRGALPEIVRDGESGVLVSSNDPEHWLEALRWAISHPDELALLGRRGRLAFEGRYTEEAGYRQLAEIYSRTIERANTRPRSAATSSAMSS
jgi:glycosyltransferase involved in cell wall biosynthesis